MQRNEHKHLKLFTRLGWRKLIEQLQFPSNFHNRICQGGRRLGETLVGASTCRADAMPLLYLHLRYKMNKNVSRV